MKLRFQHLLLVLPLIFCACKPNLERKGIPILGGISIDSASACQVTVLRENLRAYQKHKLDGWVVEIPMVIQPFQESSAFRYYEGHSLDTLVQLLQDHQIRYTLAFHLRNPHMVTPMRFQADPYLTDMSGLLLRTMSYPPDNIVFMGVLLDTSMMADKLQVFTSELKNEFRDFGGEIVYAARPDDLIRPSFDWNTPDAIGIIYDKPPDENYKSYFRETNSKLSVLFIQHNKPGLIVQSNLLGDDKLLMFKNQLRFWSSEVALKGIVLNTIYCGFSLTDTSTYFALGDDGNFHEYLQHYISLQH